ncbi:MAG: S41 family peptidase, partial [Robiginitalea sp.]
LIFSQDCDCNSNFAWVKKTFEENDAGYAYALQKKGRELYEAHNNRIGTKAAAAETLQECQAVLYEWLTFFRPGHIGLQLHESVTQQSADQSQVNSFPDWETYAIPTEDFRAYLDEQGEDPGFEGIWETSSYGIGIKKEGDTYVGFIVESGAETWSEGQVKLKFQVEEERESGVFYMYDHSPVAFDKISMLGANSLQLGRFNLRRRYPALPGDPRLEAYIKSKNATGPYLEQWSETTLYLRIPSFQGSEKKAIDSVIAANRDKILATENLIIDIRNGTGGSDSSYKELLPMLYTNPIREVGVEFLSTKLNNQRMLDFINKPEYGFDDEGKKWAQESFDRLTKQEGAWVNLNDTKATIIEYDTVYPYPKNIGILINGGNGSTDEQFLLAAKQSRKVKLFGTSTMGVLDVSNMYFVPSPCDEFYLGYCLTRSLRIPDFTIDQHGIQPDFYMDTGIPEYEWVSYAQNILKGE